VTVRREHIERVSFNLRQKLYLNVRFHFVDRPLSLNLANGSSWPVFTVADANSQDGSRGR